MTSDEAIKSGYREWVELAAELGHDLRTAQERIQVLEEHVGVLLATHRELQSCLASLLASCQELQDVCRLEITPLGMVELERGITRES